jgi:hypothetical protein
MARREISGDGRSWIDSGVATLDLSAAKGIP